MPVWHHPPGPLPASTFRSPPFCAKAPGRVFPSRVLKSRACHGRARRGCQSIATSLFSLADFISADQSPKPRLEVVLRDAGFQIRLVLSPSSSDECVKPRFPNSESRVYTYLHTLVVGWYHKQTKQSRPQPTNRPPLPPIPGHTPELQLDPPPPVGSQAIMASLRVTAFANTFLLPNDGHGGPVLKVVGPHETRKKRPHRVRPRLHMRLHDRDRRFQTGN